MKRESRRLYTKGVDSLVLCIEHYNRPWDRGRVSYERVRRLDEGSHPGRFTLR